MPINAWNIAVPFLKVMQIGMCVICAGLRLKMDTHPSRAIKHGKNPTTRRVSHMPMHKNTLMRVGSVHQRDAQDLTAWILVGWGRGVHST
jgi:hypothetical protein